MSPYIELRLLRYAIAVAEELHFARAAARLHLSAPSLSKQIRQFEESLGYALFERRTREVLLTAAGTAFLTEARQALVYAERAVECGSAASRGDTGVLAIGYTADWFDSFLLTTIRKRFTESRPDTVLTLHSVSAMDQIDMLLKGSLHAGLVHLPIDGGGLQMRTLWREPMALALPEGYHLSSRDEIGVGQLVEQPMVWIDRAINPWLHDHLLRSCQRLGCTPSIAQEVKALAEAIDWVAAGAGIAMVRASTVQRFQHRGVAFRPLAAPGLTVETGVAYRGDSRSEALKALVEILREQSTPGDS